MLVHVRARGLICRFAGFRWNQRSCNSNPDIDFTPFMAPKLTSLCTYRSRRGERGTHEERGGHPSHLSFLPTYASSRILPSLKKKIMMHACLVDNAFIVLSAQEYVENLEGCEALADRLARPSQTGQEEVHLNWNLNWYADPNRHIVLKFL